MKATKFPQAISLLAAGLVAVVALTASAVDEPVNNAPAPAAANVYKIQYVSPTAQVEKLVKAGISEDVIKAYVASAASPFNLTPDNIIHLQSLGVSGAVLTEMLSHDKLLRDTATAQPPAYPQPQLEQPAPTNPQPTVAYTAPDSTPYYNDLAGYGNWNYDTAYGWGWQPYSWLGYDYYPWGILGYGGWAYWPNRGWCWHPNSRFHTWGRGNAFAGNRFRGGVNRSFAGGRSFSGVRGGSGPSVSHFGGASHFSGGHGGGFSGGHTGGFSGGHTGGFSGGGHAGGFGGGHGGGGGHR